jgi:hypothetical protein
MQRILRRLGKWERGRGGEFELTLLKFRVQNTKLPVQNKKLDQN